YNSLTTNDLDISGGWSTSFGDPCGVQVLDQPYGTLIDGENSSRGLSITVGYFSEVHVSRIGFINGYVAGFERGGAINFSRPFVDAIGEFVVTHCMFINNEAYSGSAISYDIAYLSTFSNNLAAANFARNGNSISMVGASTLNFINNTVINNETVGINGGAYLSAVDDSLGLVANNVLWGNDGSDLRLNGDRFFVKNNDIGFFDSGTQIEQVGNFSLPPRLELVNLVYVPGVASPLINKGIKPCSTCPIPLPFDEQWILPSIDLAGHNRLQHGVVDIGALESSIVSDLVFWGRFE
ncbi:MAG: hypothetical protein ACSHWU_06180, partial [Marinicella sp.]